MAALCCPRCGLDYALPVEPLYTLDSVALLLPMKKRSLQSWLRKHRNDYEMAAPKYMRGGGRTLRFLDTNEIKYIRATLLLARPRDTTLAGVAARRPLEAPAIHG